MHTFLSGSLLPGRYAQLPTTSAKTDLPLNQIRGLWDPSDLIVQVRCHRIQDMEDRSDEVATNLVSDFLQRDAACGRILSTLIREPHRNRHSLMRLQGFDMPDQPVIQEIACSIAHITLHPMVSRCGFRLAVD
jgi:hypothetical protein